MYKNMETCGLAIVHKSFGMIIRTLGLPKELEIANQSLGFGLPKRALGCQKELGVANKNFRVVNKNLGLPINPGVVHKRFRFPIRTFGSQLEL